MMRRAVAAPAVDHQHDRRPSASLTVHRRSPTSEEEEHDHDDDEMEEEVLTVTRPRTAPAAPRRVYSFMIGQSRGRRRLLHRGSKAGRGGDSRRRLRDVVRLVLGALAGAGATAVLARWVLLLLVSSSSPPTMIGPDSEGGRRVADAPDAPLFRRSVRVEVGPPQPLDRSPPNLQQPQLRRPAAREHAVADPLVRIGEQPLPRKSLPSFLNGTDVPDYDYDRYTVRINSWKRQDQLQLSIRHLLSCGANGDTKNEPMPLAEIQVVWCTAQGPPPEWLLQLEQESNHSAVLLPRVTVERHDVNSLNERFHMLSPTSTAAILSVDDDVLRPCVAMDAAFLKWRRQPHRMVGFDARTIVVDEATHRLKYGYLSTTQNTNVYSLTLSRFAFVHQHYLRTYMTDLPATIRKFIDQNLNCEDIALSLWVSYQTDNLPPLLADYWAMKSMVKLESSSAISSTNNHKSVRDACVHDFVRQLQLSVPTLQSPFVHYHSDGQSRPDHFWFDCGADDDEVAVPWPARNVTTKHLQKVRATVERWKHGSIRQGLHRDLNRIVREMSHDAYQQGYLKNTDPWRAKFRKQGHSQAKDVASEQHPVEEDRRGVEVGIDTA